MSYSTVLGTTFGDIPFAISHESLLYGKRTIPLSEITGFTYCLTRHDLLAGPSNMKRVVGDRFIYHYLIGVTAGLNIDFTLNYSHFVADADQRHNLALQGALWTYIGDRLITSVADALAGKRTVMLAGCTLRPEGIEFTSKTLMVLSKTVFIPWSDIVQSEQNGTWTISSAGQPGRKKSFDLRSELNAVVLKRFLGLRR